MPIVLPDIPLIQRALFLFYILNMFTPILRNKYWQMKILKVLPLTIMVFSLLTWTSCENDESQIGIPLENCDLGDCDQKDCATFLNIRDRVTCTIDNNDDVDWYAYEVDEADVNNNSGNYSFNFINDSESMNIRVDIFTEGVAGGKVLSSGNGDGIYEAGLDLTGGVTFLEQGTYYIKVSREDGNIGNGVYHIRIN